MYFRVFSVPWFVYLLLALSLLPHWNHWNNDTCPSAPISMDCYRRKEGILRDIDYSAEGRKETRGDFRNTKSWNTDAKLIQSLSNLFRVTSITFPPNNHVLPIKLSSLTFGFSSGCDLRVLRSSPSSGSMLSEESAWDSLCPSLPNLLSQKNK